MARQFSGTAQSLQSAATVDLSPAGTGPITVAYWGWWDSYLNLDNLALEMSADYGTNDGTFIVDPDSSGGGYEFAHHSTGGFRAASIVRPSVGAWHHYMFVFYTDSSVNNVAYVDGVSVTVTPGTNNGGGAWGNFLLNVMSRNNASLFGAGRMAGLGIWGSALTAGNATTLAGGAAPASVGSPLFAWNICGIVSPEPAAVGGIALTLSASAPTFVADPATFVGCLASNVSKILKPNALRPAIFSPGRAR